MTKQVNATSRVNTSESSWRCTRTYIASPDQVRFARAFVRGALEDCPMVDETALLVSDAMQLIQFSIPPAVCLAEPSLSTRVSTSGPRSETAADYGQARPHELTAVATDCRSWARRHATGAATAPR
jgi:hypothetical protein